MDGTHKNLMLVALTNEQHSHTCGYWYTITEGSMPHTAFRTKEAALSWLRALGMSIDGQLPKERGEHAVFHVHGSYRRELLTCSAETFAELPGVPVAVLSNGEYTTGKLHTDTGNGMRVIYVPNPNCEWREKHDYRECRAMEDDGVMVL